MANRGGAISLKRDLLYIPRNETIYFFTDSNSSILLIKDIITKPKPLDEKSIETIRRLIYLAKHNTVTIQFIPAHQGIPLNEEADKAAKDATTNGKRSHYPPTKQAYITQLKKLHKEKLITYLNRTIKNSQLHESSPDRTNFKKLHLIDATTSLLLNRARTGHTRCATHLKKIGVLETDSCRHTAITTQKL